MTDLVITGAAGRLGQVLRAAWSQTPPPGLRPLWMSRDGRLGDRWDLASGAAPDLPPGCRILHLAMDRGAGPDAAARNAAMTEGLLQAAREARATVLLASSAAVYAPGPNPCREDDTPQPPAAYGRAKLAAERALRAQGDVTVHILRIGNIAGIDALLGPRDGLQPVVLDPVPGRPGGPVRSWIGARSLTAVLAGLCRAELPPVLNLAADPPLAMADLLDADGRPWRYGPPRDGVLAQVTLDLALLRGLLPVPAAQAPALADEARWARGVLA